MTRAGEFLDAALQRESSFERAAADRERLGDGRRLVRGLPLGGGLRFYGASVGAVRGAVRDALRRYRGLDHDEVTALAGELWAVPVFERRLAAVVLLQSRLELLNSSDLTRIEGFVRTAGLRALVDPLAVDVLGPMLEGLDRRSRSRADAALDRWAVDDEWLGRAALLSPVRALRAGGGDWDGFVRRAARAGAGGDGGGEAADAVAVVLAEVARHRPDLATPATP